MSWLLALWIPTASARCATPATSDEIRRTAAVALDGYAEDRMSTFHRASAEAGARIPCLGEVVLPEALAGWYVVQGIQAFLDRRTEDMLDSFQIAWSLDPDFPCDERLGPEGHPLRLACKDAVLRPPFGDLPPQECDPGSVFVDGLLVSALPADRPFVAQLVPHRDNSLRGTWVVPGPDAVPDRLTCRVARNLARQTAIGAVGSAAAAGAIWVASGLAVTEFRTAARDGEEGRWQMETSDKDKLLDAAARANTLGTSAQVATGLAVGLGVVSLALVVRF